MKRLLGALIFYGRFAPSFSAIGYRWRRRGWPIFEPNFSGQRWLVTGASGGIGAAVSIAAARAGAEVVAVARDPAKLARLPASLRTECCDFSSIRDVSRWIDESVVMGKPFDVLVNNVGVMLHQHRLTAEGHEPSYVTNLLSHYQLTESLLTRDLLRRGSAVINVTSGGAYAAPLSARALDARTATEFNGTTAYALHKRAQIALTQHWQERHAERGVSFYAMHPGWADTAGVQSSLPTFRRWMKPILRDAEAGADTVLWLAAERPASGGVESVWFDRARRPAHVFSYTARESVPVGTVVAQLNQDWDRSRT